MVDRRAAADYVEFEFFFRLFVVAKVRMETTEAVDRSRSRQMPPAQPHQSAQRHLVASPARPAVVGGRAAAQIRSEDYRDVVSAPPPFLVRSGAIMTAVALLTLAIVAWVVPYPSVVGGRAHIVSAQLPVTLLSRGSGKLALLAVNEGDEVNRDDILAVIDDGS